MLKCKECLLWRNRREHLGRLAIDLVEFCCARKYDIADEIAISTDRDFREHIGLMDTECQDECTLLEVK